MCMSDTGVAVLFTLQCREIQQSKEKVVSTTFRLRVELLLQHSLSAAASEASSPTFHCATSGITEHLGEKPQFWSSDAKKKI